MSKYRSLSEQEKELCRQNGIDPEKVTVSYKTDDALYLLNYKTRDTIAIYRGDRKW